jgi:hypothetical protein
VVLYLGNFFYHLEYYTIFGFQVVKDKLLIRNQSLIHVQYVVAIVTMQCHFIAQYQVVAAKIITLKVKLRKI